jgi:methionyl-tRNA formyltransferase
LSAVFMGTPDIAVPCLEALVAWSAGPVRVVTQPDRPAGRSGQPQPSPVKARALELGLEVAQPQRLRHDEGILAWLAQPRPEVIVVVAFGQILPRAVLDLPVHGCINVHFSALPRYRGAAPVQWALIRGEEVTAVDTMLMDEGLDTGPVLLSRKVPIEDEENAGELAARLRDVAPMVLSKTLKEWVAGRLTPTDQDSSQATPAPRLTKEDGRLDWSRPAKELANRVRGVTPWPGAMAEVGGQELKVLRARPSVVADASAAPGEVCGVDAEHGLLVATGDGALWLRQVQAPGRRAVSGAAYAAGRRLAVRDRCEGDSDGG